MKNHLLKHPELDRLGDSTCQKLTFQDMVDGVVKECRREESPTMKVKVKVASRPRQNSLGDSTNLLLDFQEMIAFPVKKTRQPRLRLERSRTRSGVDRSRSLNVTTTMRKEIPKVATCEQSGVDRSRSLYMTIAMRKEIRKVVTCELSTPRPSPKRAVHKSQSFPPLLSPTLGRSKTWPRVLVDVAPGLSVQLCGTEESVEAFHHHRVNETVCSNCDTFLYCIDSADLVLCPICRSISPVEVESSNNSTNNTYTTETLGMGLAVDQVFGK